LNTTAQTLQQQRAPSEIGVHSTQSSSLSFLFASSLMSGRTPFDAISNFVRGYSDGQNTFRMSLKQQNLNQNSEMKHNFFNYASC
jgi:hypothetical protein